VTSGEGMRDGRALRYDRERGRWAGWRDEECRAQDCMLAVSNAIERSIRAGRDTPSCSRRRSRLNLDLPRWPLCPPSLHTRPHEYREHPCRICRSCAQNHIAVFASSNERFGRVHRARSQAPYRAPQVGVIRGLRGSAPREPMPLTRFAL
jgi:hypothetical protein